MIPAFIIDSGSFSMKVGLSNESHFSNFRTICGRIKHPGHLTFHENLGIPLRDVFVGDEAFALRAFMGLKQPVEQGVVCNFHDWEAIINYSYRVECGLNPVDFPVLLTSSPNLDSRSKERIAQIMFETFEVPAMATKDTATLSLFATGRSSGCVVGSGHGLSYAASIIDGRLLVDSVRSGCISGKDVDENLAGLLIDKWCFATQKERDCLRFMKEKFAFIANSSPLNSKQTCKWPDGEEILLESERWQCSEPLFVGQNDSKTVQGAVIASIEKCPEVSRSQMLNHIILSGGNTLFSGFKERLSWEIKILSPSATTVNVVQSTKKTYGAWIGGAVLSRHSSFERSCITRSEYEAFGPDLIHHR